MVMTISSTSFDNKDLDPGLRSPGISAFMRIRNGADFLEASIRSHIDYFDEIVAVYNQCTDDTPWILSRLAGKYGKKLRVFHYTDRVYPPGSEGHAKTPPDSPNSFVNYSNIALAQTRFSYAIKLDDDHLAIPGETARVTELIRRGGTSPGEMLCFSGLNLIRNSSGQLGIYGSDPLSGSGDVGFFPVSGETYFTHDRRFEEFRLGGLKRVFAGFLYWHLKYLKKGLGFDNYELGSNPCSRFHKRLKALNDRPEIWTEMEQAGRRLQPGLADALLSIFSEKKRLINARDRAIIPSFGVGSVENALAGTVQKQWLDNLRSKIDRRQQ